VTRSLRLSILTPTEPVVLADDIAWLQARLADGGSIGIWPGHAPLIAETVCGPVRYSDGSGEHRVELQAGLLHVESGGVVILVPGVLEADAPADPDQGRANREGSRAAER
jgi:F-type H+-transporting ATPase subunit epsilon